MCWTCNWDIEVNYVDNSDNLFRADLLINRSNPHTSETLYEADKEQDNTMEKKELIDLVMEMIEAKTVTANNKAQFSVEPFLAAREAQETQAGWSRAKDQGGYQAQDGAATQHNQGQGDPLPWAPYPPTGMTKVKPRQPPYMPQAPSKTNLEFMLDQAKNIATTYDETAKAPPTPALESQQATLASGRAEWAVQYQAALTG